MQSVPRKRSTTVLREEVENAITAVKKSAAADNLSAELIQAVGGDHN